MLFDKYKGELKSLYKFYAGSSGMTFAVFSQMAKVRWCGARMRGVGMGLVEGGFVRGGCVWVPFL